MANLTSIPIIYSPKEALSFTFNLNEAISPLTLVADEKAATAAPSLKSDSIAPSTSISPDTNSNTDSSYLTRAPTDFVASVSETLITKLTVSPLLTLLISSVSFATGAAQTTTTELHITTRQTKTENRRFLNKLILSFTIFSYVYQLIRRFIIYL